MPDLGLFMKTFVSSYLAGNELMKYVDKTNATRKENGKTTFTNTSSAFYFYGKNLIKVEEAGDNNGKLVNAGWYYFNDNPLYYTVQSDKSEERSKFLLTMGKSIQSKFQQKK